jgi:hypothetical protein
MNEDLARIKAKFKARRVAKASPSLVAAAEPPRCPWCSCAAYRETRTDTNDFVFRGKAWVTISVVRICNHCKRSWTRVVSEGPKDQPTPPPAPPRVKKKVKVATPIYRPTKEEIRAACEEIQRGWSPAERRRRSTVTDVRWAVRLLKREDLGTLD